MIFIFVWLGRLLTSAKESVPQSYIKLESASANQMIRLLEGSGSQDDVPRTVLEGGKGTILSCHSVFFCSGYESHFLQCSVCN
jgi:hypothetical protein